MKPPALTLSKLPKVIRVKAGEPLHIEIPYTGTDPLIRWNKDGDKLQPQHKTRHGMRLHHSFTSLFNVDLCFGFYFKHKPFMFSGSLTA